MREDHPVLSGGGADAELYQPPPVALGRRWASSPSTACERTNPLTFLQGGLIRSLGEAGVWRPPLATSFLCSFHTISPHQHNYLHAGPRAPEIFQRVWGCHQVGVRTLLRDLDTLPSADGTPIVFSPSFPPV